MYFANNNKLCWSNKSGTLTCEMPKDVHVIIDTSNWTVTDIGSAFACAQAINNMAILFGEQSKILNNSIVMDLTGLHLDLNQMVYILNDGDNGVLWQFIHDTQSNPDVIKHYIDARM